MGTSLTPDSTDTPSIEFVLSQHANDAIAKGANPQAVSERLGQMVTHLRSNPELASQASDALAKGADIGAIAPRILKLASNGSGNVNLGSTGTPRKPVAAPQTPPNAAEGIADSGLDNLTFGLHRKGLGVTQAIGDLLTHGTNSHPLDTYNKSVESTLAREHAASAEHPTATTAANATGFFGALAAEAPLRALLGVGEAAPAAATAMKRIGQSAKTGGVTGAAIGATSSEGTGEHRALDALGGGVLGGIFGGGSQALAEGGGKIADVFRQLTTSPEKAGAKAADQHIVQRLNADDLEPKDLLNHAQVAQHTGSPAVVAHLGGPSLDPLTWLASQGPSREAGTLRTAINQGQRQEGSLLNRGISEMSGVPDTPSADASVFTNKLDAVRKAKAAENYPKAYAAKPVNDPRILNIIRNDPELSDALAEGVKIMQRENDVARIHGALGQDVANPLEQSGTAAALAKMGVPADKINAAGFGNSESIPVQMLDYMKRGSDVVVERGLKKGNLSAHDAGLLSQKVDAILQAVDAQVPEYAAARSQYAQTSGQIEAASAGKKAFKNSGAAIGDELSQLSPDAIQAHRTGFTSELRGDLASKGNDSNLSRTFDNPFTQGQLSAEYGEKGVGKMSPYLDQGNALNRVRESASGNSQTAPRQAIRQEVLGAGAADAMDLPTTPKHAILRILNAKDAARRQAVLQTLAARLNVPADSPELPKVVESLYKSIEGPTTDASRPNLGKVWKDALSDANLNPALRGINAVGDVTLAGGRSVLRTLLEGAEGAAGPVVSPRGAGILAGLFAGRQ